MFLLRYTALSLPSIVVSSLLLTVLAHTFKSTIHPNCKVLTANESFFECLQDITSVLHGLEGIGTGALPSSTCVYNPSVLRFRDDIYIWGARYYVPHDSRHECSSDPSALRTLLPADGWRGTHGFILAATQTRWGFEPKCNITHELVGFVKFDVPLEDPRLFRDGEGAVWVLAHNPRGGAMTVQHLAVNCDSSSGRLLRCDMSLGPLATLQYSDGLPREKNWVPHNGTTRMSYPIFPTFAPHSGFDWASYHHPAAKQAFDFQAPLEPFFEGLASVFKGQIELAGSTPAVLYDDGLSYLALGHVRAHALCFHDPDNPAVTRPTCGELTARPVVLRKRAFLYTYGGAEVWHHSHEYAMFLYRFSSEPPHRITHISHAFVPPTHFDQGIVYPAGLDRIGPAGLHHHHPHHHPHHHYLVSYGESDRYCRIAVLSRAAVARALRPVAEAAADITSYTLCTLPWLDGA